MCRFLLVSVGCRSCISLTVKSLPWMGYTVAPASVASVCSSPATAQAFTFTKAESKLIVSLLFVTPCRSVPKLVELELSPVNNFPRLASAAEPVVRSYLQLVEREASDALTHASTLSVVNTCPVSMRLHF